MNRRSRKNGLRAAALNNPGDFLTDWRRKGNLPAFQAFGRKPLFFVSLWIEF